MIVQRLVALALAVCMAPAAYAQSADLRPVSLARIADRLGTDSVITGSTQPICGIARDRELSSRYFNDIADDTLHSIFNAEFARAELPVQGESDNLFATQSTQTDFSIAGAFTEVTGNFCLGIVQSLGNGRARLTVKMEWQVFSAIQREVIARIPTEASVEENTHINQVANVIVSGFAKNVEALAASSELRDILSRPAPGPAGPAAAEAVVMTGGDAAASIPIDEALGSVVNILNGAGHGSGVLVGAEGYIVTNAHVVGDASQVTIRWSDQLETVGEVVRKDDGRDVALIQTRPRGRRALAFQSRRPGIGTDVFAVGTPLDTELQNSVTRGIVSGNRILDGFAYIQSDVNINPGNSGGPLLDSEGRIVGLSVSIRLNDQGVPSGIAYFIPAQDVIDFLRMDIRASAPL